MPRSVFTVREERKSTRSDFPHTRRKKKKSPKEKWPLLPPPVKEKPPPSLYNRGDRRKRKKKARHDRHRKVSIFFFGLCVWGFTVTGQTTTKTDFFVISWSKKGKVTRGGGGTNSRCG